LTFPKRVVDLAHLGVIGTAKTSNKNREYPVVTEVTNLLSNFVQGNVIWCLWQVQASANASLSQKEQLQW
jgi:hypothetical protein